MSALAELDLLEREPELETLRRVLDAAHDGAGRLVAIEGPPGIGKTRLLRAASALAAAAGLQTLWARGGELERELPYGVVHRLFAGAEADATEHDLYRRLVNLSARRAVLVAVDDLHWVDAPSLRFLTYLQRRLDGVPVVLACGLRPAEAGEQAAAVVDDPDRVLLRPRPLTGVATAQYVAAVLAREAEPEFAETCHRVTGGNPRLLRELLLALHAEGVAPDDERADSVQPLGAAALAVQVRGRLARLGRHATALAGAVSVLGETAQIHLAAELAALPGEAADEAADRLLRAGVLRADPAGMPPEAGFAEPVVRAAVYGDLAPIARARLHARAARLLAAAGAQPHLVAFHLLHAPPAGDAWAVEELRHAAARSLADGAADSAGAYLRRALVEPPPPAERPAMMLELGCAELRIRPPAAIAPLREAVAMLDRPDERAEASLELARALVASGQIQDAVEVLARALEDPRAAPDRLARLEAELVGLCRHLPDRYEYAAGRLARLRLRRTGGEPLTTGEAMLLAAGASHIVREGERREEAIATARQALAGGRLMHELTASAYAVAVEALGWCDELEAAVSLHGERLAYARSRGAIACFALGSGFRAGAWFQLGALSEAEADARMALDTADRHGVALARFWAAAHLADVLLERGEIDEAEALLEGLPPGDDPAGAYFLHAPRQSRALLRLAQGRAVEAAADLIALGRDLAAIGVAGPPISPWRSLAAAALRGHDPERALLLAEEEVALARRWGAPRALGGALRVNGLVAGGDDGLELLREAASVLEESPAKLERARALSDLGAALRRSGRRADAREPLRIAVELAQDCGATPLAEDARAELVSAGARPRRDALSGAESLTPSERRVAAMAAEGMTNRDIAQSLFVTAKTVEVHLSSVYRKLDIGSRHQLAAALGDTTG